MEIQNIESFLDYYEKVRGRTLRVINCIPPDKIDWTYREGKFTLGDLIRHIAAIERFMYAETVQGKPSRYDGHKQEFVEGFDKTLSYFNGLHYDSMEIFKSLTNEDLQSKCQTPAGTQITVWKWLRAMVEHEIHHRGQIYVYLAMLGVETPPIFGLTSEEVVELSKKEV